MQNQRRSLRLANFDYSSDEDYFVTICSHNRRKIFGEMKSDRLHPTPLGEIIITVWKEIPAHFVHCKLDEWILMPNHMHGIISIQHVGNAHGRSLRRANLSVVMNSFKSTVTRKYRAQTGDQQKIWQKSYYDHIVRSSRSLEKIRQYIIENPYRWDEGTENNGIHG